MPTRHGLLSCCTGESRPWTAGHIRIMLALFLGTRAQANRLHIVVCKWRRHSQVGMVATNSIQIRLPVAETFRAPLFSSCVSLSYSREVKKSTYRLDINYIDYVAPARGSKVICRLFCFTSWPLWWQQRHPQQKSCFL